MGSRLPCLGQGVHGYHPLPEPFLPESVVRGSGNMVGSRLPLTGRATTQHFRRTPHYRWVFPVAEAICEGVLRGSEGYML